MTGVVETLHREHANIAKLLDLLEGQVKVFETGGVPDYDLVEHIVDYFLDFPETCHHPKEDLVMERLRARDPAAAAAVGDLAAEHKELAATTRRFAALLDELLQDAQMPRDAFPRTARNFVENQREHMNKEETHFLPAAEAALKPEDWAAIVQVLGDTEDPLFGERTENRFAALRTELLG